MSSMSRRRPWDPQKEPTLTCVPQERREEYLLRAARKLLTRESVRGGSGRFRRSRSCCGSRASTDAGADLELERIPTPREAILGQFHEDDDQLVLMCLFEGVSLSRQRSQMKRGSALQRCVPGQAEDQATPEPPAVRERSHVVRRLEDSSFSLSFMRTLRISLSTLMTSGGPSKRAWDRCHRNRRRRASNSSRTTRRRGRLIHARRKLDRLRQVVK